MYLFLSLQCSNVLYIVLYSYISIACQYTGNIRIRGTPRKFEGLVQICINNNWHRLCDDSDNWNVDTATVVCKSLNFSGPGSKQMEKIMDRWMDGWMANKLMY